MRALRQLAEGPRIRWPRAWLRALREPSDRVVQQALEIHRAHIRRGERELRRRRRVKELVRANFLEGGVRRRGVHREEMLAGQFTRLIVLIHRRDAYVMSTRQQHLLWKEDPVTARGGLYSAFRVGRVIVIDEDPHPGQSGRLALDEGRRRVDETTSRRCRDRRGGIHGLIESRALPRIRRGLRFGKAPLNDLHQSFAPGLGLLQSASREHGPGPSRFGEGRASGQRPRLEVHAPATATAA
ncbi:hypothetical protein [Corallococcus terminator]|uniref:hypothetical protein n=1 Tax=Corallococcus terminator TaxID=2316733 RepID=UPI001FC98BFB|nr:hypothetical protein [Corallococcus terminator]